MNRVPIGLATCLVAAVTVGCGTVTASQPVTGAATTAAGHAGQTPRTATRGPAQARPTSPGPTSPRPAGTGVPPGCQGAAPGGPILLITTAGNGKTYCVRVGDQVEVQLQGTRSSPWLEPLASSNVLRPVPNGQLSPVAGLTEKWFAGARPGQVFITSIRPPCQGLVMFRKAELEPAYPLPKLYSLRSCTPERRFSVVIMVS
jgi:hypothetical protein